MSHESYVQYNLNDLIRELGEDRVKSILSDFSCPQNDDVQYFAREKAIEFSKRGFAKTHLVYYCNDKTKENRFVGYYTIANKNILVSKRALNQKARSRIHNHGDYISELKKYLVTAPLIGQLGKNFKDNNDKLISGDELLGMAIDKIQKAQYDIGGKFIYLECEDVEYLRKFYKRNGFVAFGKRKLDADETNIKGKELIQLLLYSK